MACLTKSNRDNFITFNKVNGSLTLSELQALGSIDICQDILLPPVLVGDLIDVDDLDLSWNDVGGQTGFTLERKINAGSYSTLASLASNVFEYTDSTIVPGSTYTYRIKADGATTDSEYSNEYVVSDIADVTHVLDRMPTLSDAQKTAVARFIVAENNDGNYSKYAEFFCFALGSTNGLIGFKSKTATGVNTPTFGSNGVTFDDASSEYINTNFNPSTDSGGVYNNTNVLIEFFQYAYEEPASYPAIVTGSIDTTEGSYINFGTYEIIPSTAYGSRIGILDNNVLAIAHASGGIDLRDDEDLYSLERSGLSTRRTRRDGVSDGSTGSSALAQNFPDFNLFVGAENFDGSPQNYYKGTLSSYLIGDRSGMDFTAHNTNLRAFLTELGVSI